MKSTEKELSRLERCPVCDYRLEGLPESHQCPECGFAFNPSMQIINQSPVTAVFMVILVVGTLVLLISGTSFRNKLMTYIVFPMGNAYALWYVYGFFMHSRNRVVIWPEGVAFVESAHVSKLLTRADIRVVLLTSMEVAFVLEPNGTTYSVSEHELGSRKSLKRLFSLVKETGLAEAEDRSRKFWGK